MAESVGSAFVEISASNAKLQSDLEESKAIVIRELSKAEHAADMGDTVRSSIGGIKLLREEQTRTANSMTEMGSIGRRELILLSSQFGSTGVAAQRLFMLMQYHSALAATAMRALMTAIVPIGIAFGIFEIIKGIDQWISGVKKVFKEEDACKLKSEEILGIMGTREKAAEHLVRLTGGEITDEKEIYKYTNMIRDKTDEYVDKLVLRERLESAFPELQREELNKMVERKALEEAILNVNKDVTAELAKQKELQDKLAAAQKEFKAAMAGVGVRIYELDRTDYEKRKRAADLYWTDVIDKAKAAEAEQTRIEELRAYRDRELAKIDLDETKRIAKESRRIEIETARQELSDMEELKKAQMDELTTYLNDSQKREQGALDDKMHGLEEEMRGVREKHNAKMRLLEEEERKRKKIQVEILGGPKELWGVATKTGISTRDLEEKRYSLEKKLGEDICALTKEIEKAREQERQLHKIEF
jgi:hypothetical protein